MSWWRSSKLAFFAIAFLLVGTTGCVSQEKDVALTSSLQEYAATETMVLPTNTILPIKTLTSTSTPTVVPTKTPAATTTISPENICPEREALDFQSGILSPGKVIFEQSDGLPRSAGGKNNWYYFSSEDKEIYPFMDDLESGLLFDFYVSPDKKWLSFGRESLLNERYVHKLFIMNIASGEHFVIPWDEENWSYVITGWLANSQQLSIIPREESNSGRKDDIIVFDPFTQQQQTITPSFPDPGDVLPEYTNFFGRTSLYDPSMKMVAYYVGHHPNMIVLWDNERLQDVWQYTAQELMTFAKPSWSPDGTILTLIDQTPDIDNPYGFQIMFVNHAGEVTRSEVLPGSMRLQKYSWSPNQRYINIHYQYTDWEYRSRLFLLDTHINELIDLCVENVARGPIWSSDSRQFLVQIEEITQENIPEAQRPHINLLVDVEKGKVFEINFNELDPIIWLPAP